MKDSLFEMLMNFFEKSLSQLKESNIVKDVSAAPVKETAESYDSGLIENKTLVIKPATKTAMRVFTQEEQIKFTKASQQFLIRLILWGVFAPETIEIIINQLSFSDSRYVTLQETKWTIRNMLAENLDTAQVAFLDLVLYQKEDELPIH